MTNHSRMIATTTILTLAAVGQIILAFVLYNKDGNTTVINLGWIILWISAIFGQLPIFTFKKYGGVPKGKSYIQTTILVDRGVYAIVRHPQYLAGILIGIALPLISQHWLVAILGIVAISTYVISANDEEASAIQKFGNAYQDYMSRVPRFNFLLGFYRLLVKKICKNGITSDKRR